jgi:hypothetical protein
MGNKKDKTAPARNRLHRAALAESGIVIVQVRVPVERREEILEMARKMRDNEG